MSSNASSGGGCIHCGAALGAKSLAQHMGSGECLASGGVEGYGRPHAGFEAPVLEEAPDDVCVNEEDLRRRRRLADRLDEEDVWPGAQKR